MNKKGFTLLELIGVLVILSLLMLLVFPKLINLIKSSNSTKDNITEELIYMNVDTYVKDRTNIYKKDKNNQYCITLKEIVDNTELNEPLELNGEDIINTKSIQISYNEEFKYEIIDTDSCIEKRKIYQNGEIVYFDVLNGISCSEEEYHEDNSKTGYNGITTSTENQNGCLKFYAFNDKGEVNLNLILDHNTTALVSWNSSGSNTSGPKELIEQLKSDTDAWKGTITPTNYTMDQTSQSSGASYTVDYSNYKARLITANEIAEITGNTGWDEISSSSSWYYLDSLTQTRKDTCKEGDTSGCSYGWLYDRTHEDCIDYGCLNNSDTRTLGYWTVSSFASSSSNAWLVFCDGYVSGDDVSSAGVDLGLRPVITILKSKL